MHQLILDEKIFFILRKINGHLKIYDRMTYVNSYQKMLGGRKIK